MALNTDFQTAFDRLVTAWIGHEELRSHGSVAQLMESRSALDELRYEASSLANRLA